MKKGISLIVLVITIIVMIILAASVVITLSNTGVIDRAGQAVDLTNEASVQDLAALTWADAYLDNLRGQDLIDEVEKKLEEQGVTKDKWNITITETGVNIAEKATSVELGTLITSGADYGKTINYEANGITDWKVLYKTEDYVYIITSDIIPGEKISDEFVSDTKGYKMDDGVYWDKYGFTATTRTLNKDLWLAKARYNDNSKLCSMVASYLIDEYYWTAFKNSEYGENVVGAIGTPTLEMFVASWNQKRADTGDTTTYNKEITLNLSSGAYEVNSDNYVTINTADDLYCLDEWCWVAGPAQHGSNYMYNITDTGWLQGSEMTPTEWFDFGGGATTSYPNYSLRPVVCLKASTPAKAGTTIDIELVK